MKVIDFSLAVFFKQPAEPCGTPEFMAPELITAPDDIAKTGELLQDTVLASDYGPVSCVRERSASPHSRCQALKNDTTGSCRLRPASRLT